MKSCFSTFSRLNCLAFFILLLLSPSKGSAQVKPDEKELELRESVNREFKNQSFDVAWEAAQRLLQYRINKYGADSIQVAHVQITLGAIQSQLGHYDNAISHYEKALARYESVGARGSKYLAAVFQNLGICYNAKGDIEQAKNFYENAERIISKLQVVPPDIYEGILMNLSYLYLDNKNITDAERYNEKAFLVNPVSPNNFKKWNARGLISLERKEYDKSIFLLKRALQVGEKDLGPQFAEKEVIHMNLGMVYLAMSDFDHSTYHYQIAMELIEKKAGKQNSSYSACLKDMGKNYLNKKEMESNTAKFLVLKKRNLEMALDYFQQALKTITTGSMPDEWQSNPAIDEVINKTILLELVKNKAETLLQLSQIEDNLKSSGESLKHLKLSLSTFELAIKTIQTIKKEIQTQESRFYLSANEHPVYAEALEVAVNLYEKSGERQYFDKGFEISERSRSADFQTMLREIQAKKTAGIPDSVLQREMEIKGEIAAYENFIFNEKSAEKPDLVKINHWKDKLFSLKQGYQQMMSLIERSYPNYYEYKYADPIVSVQKIQQNLNRREAFIEYFINESKQGRPGELYTFVITDHEYRLIRKSIHTEFDTRLDQILKFIRNSNVLTTHKADYLSYADNAYSLFKFLIEPITPFMENFRLVLVPDDKLAYLPFDALLASPADTTKMDFRNLDYLVHHHAISYTYSATLLYYYFQNNSKYSKKIGAFAPDYSDKPLVFGTQSEYLLPLPGAVDEVNGVTSLLSGDRFLKKEATKNQFLKTAQNYDILHLAIHTTLNDTLPLYSKMVFSADTTAKAERALNTYEIYNLRLKSDMVVLSGCNTGSGKLQKGEGVMSLARGFLFAGCPSIIMTLWNVEDVSSSGMVVEFYRNLKSGFSKDEALRRAKLDYISHADPLKAHPHYWLGYVSIGKQNALYKTKAGYFVGLIIFVFLAIVLERWYFKRKKG